MRSGSTSKPSHQRRQASSSSCLVLERNCEIRSIRSAVPGRVPGQGTASAALVVERLTDQSATMEPSQLVSWSSRRRRSPGNRGCPGSVPRTTAPRSSSPLDLSFAFGEN